MSNIKFMKVSEIFMERLKKEDEEKVVGVMVKKNCNTWFEKVKLQTSSEMVLDSCYGSEV